MTRLFTFFFTFHILHDDQREREREKKDLIFTRHIEFSASVLMNVTENLFRPNPYPNPSGIIFP